jgi:hypothetical protein
MKILLCALLLVAVAAVLAGKSVFKLYSVS